MFVYAIAAGIAAYLQARVTHSSDIELDPKRVALAKVTTFYGWAIAAVRTQ